MQRSFNLLDGSDTVDMCFWRTLSVCLGAFGCVSWCVCALHATNPPPIEVFLLSVVTCFSAAARHGRAWS